MRRSFLVEIAHNGLTDPDREFVSYLLSKVNLTLLEHEIIIRSEIDGVDLETICNSLKNWNNPKTICSYDNCAKIKRAGMLKIGSFINTICANESIKFYQ